MTLKSASTATVMIVRLATDAPPAFIRRSMDAAACIGCGACESRCPYHLPIRSMLKEAAEKFGE